MATFISVSGPAVTGKTSLMNSLSTHRELMHCQFSPDFHDLIWTDLVDSGMFYEFTDITSDPAFLCTYLHHLVDTYNSYIEAHEDDEGIIFLDGSWIDIVVYALLMMWYNRVISSAQEEVFSKALKYSDKINRYYMTKAADAKYPVDKFSVRGRLSTFKANRGLEVLLYEVFSQLDNAVKLPYAEVSGDSLMILEDLRKFGYL